MISTKTGVKTWSEAKRDTIQKPDPNRTTSAADQAQMGDENLGEQLNRVADPNWIDPTKKPRTVGNDKLDKDAFFRLMLAQMKHQDPTNPLKSHEMAAQLASFTSLEQLQNMNNTLGELKNAQKPNTNFQALSFIGKAVSGDSSKVVRAEGDVNHDFTFNLGADASDVSVKVLDGEGNAIRNYTYKNLKKGENRVSWNGQDDRGTNLRPGEYRFVAEAKNLQGKKIVVESSFEGVISGVNYTAEGPVLLVGNKSIRLADVKKIVDPSLKQNDQKLKENNIQDLSKITTPEENKDVAKTENKNEASLPSGKASANAPTSAPANANSPSGVVKASNLDKINMSKEMMEKLAKATK